MLVQSKNNLTIFFKKIKKSIDKQKTLCYNKGTKSKEKGSIYYEDD